MNKENLLKEMKECVGNKNPIEFFDKMVDIFNLLFSKLEKTEEELHKIKINSALSIKWDPRVASDLLAKQITALRQDKETYKNELHLLKTEYTRGVVTQNYDAFCQFWMDTLGYHPFLDYEK